MRILTFIFTLFILSACQSSSKYSEKRYDDENISKTKKINGIYNREFFWHGLKYYDKINGHKLIERKVYAEEKLLYKYPINQSNFPKTKIWLASGNNFLQKSVYDTIFFSNPELPWMNRIAWCRGATISRVSDSSYLIRATKDAISKSGFFISVSTNYEEIKNNNGFVSDSLILFVK